jgi:hypothetical protein
VVRYRELPQEPHASLLAIRRSRAAPRGAA